MSKYKLIAFDMDGTLLSSEKIITPLTLKALDYAADNGKEVVFCSGRCIAELRDFFSVLPKIRYAVSTSGGLVYDIKERISIFSKPIDKSLCDEIFDRIKDRDIMLHLLTAEKSIVAKTQEENMAHYKMGIYKSMYDKIATIVEDPISYARENNEDIYKINLYHTSQEERDKTRAALQDLGLEIINSEKTSIECSPKSITKGAGLEALCKYLNIDISETAAVGDSDNDLDVLKRAGLGIAMGNANEKVKETADIIVADNDHDGCAEAIKIIME